MRKEFLVITTEEGPCALSVDHIVSIQQTGTKQNPRIEIKTNFLENKATGDLPVIGHAAHYFSLEEYATAIIEGPNLTVSMVKILADKFTNEN